MDHPTFLATLHKLESDCNALMVALVLILVLQISMCITIAVHVYRGLRFRKRLTA